MSQIVGLARIWSYYAFLGLPERPYLPWALIDFSRVTQLPHRLKRFGFYGIFLKTQNYGPLSYGRSQYDYHAGTLVCVAPEQVVGIDDGGTTAHPEGLALLFEPDLLYRTPLSTKLSQYHYFSYSINEALHLSHDELIAVSTLMHLYGQARTHQEARARLKPLLQLCQTCYLRQFSSRHQLNCDALARFESLMMDYFHSDKPTTLGLPTVAWCAEQLHFSPNYLGDMIKKETGRSALAYIHHFIVDYIKQRLSDPAPTISSIAWEMGFAQPHHLSRLFKKETGLSPKAYRAQLRHL